MIPSGLAIAEKLQSQVNGFDQAVSNVQDATNAAAVADGALQTTTDILQRIRSLAVEASSDTNTTADKANLQTEVTQLLQEVNTISQNTNFNGSSLLNGSHAGFQAAVAAFTSITSNASLASGSYTASTNTNSGLLVASVAAGTSFQTSTGHAQGVSVNGATGTGTVDGTIELQVINTGTSIAVQETFVASDTVNNGSSVAVTLLSANAASTIFDNVVITTGNFQTADVGITSYIKGVAERSARVEFRRTGAKLPVGCRRRRDHPVRHFKRRTPQRCGYRISICWSPLRRVTRLVLKMPSVRSITHSPRC